MRKPYFVTWTRQGVTSKVFESQLPQDCEQYAMQHIAHGHITESIEIWDYTGKLLTVYSKCWDDLGPQYDT